jgi:metallo-beta-lactamase family protein
MNITFYGGAREVTGSMHLLTCGQDRILLDCGMFQGRRKESELKNKSLPFSTRLITNMVLSHAHIDHSGRIPLLTQGAFVGRIICTRATADACEYLLLDSAHIHESDARYLNYKTVRGLLYQMKTSPRTHTVSKSDAKKIQSLLKRDKHELNDDVINDLLDKYRLEKITPIYTTEDVKQALTFFDGYPYNEPVSIGKDMTCSFYDAGHILGSSITAIQANENGRSVNVLYTGDIGRFDRPILNNPTLKFDEADRNVDLLVMESTYGNRFHDPVDDLKPKLKEIIRETYDRGGTIVIPAFAYGRTQELLYMLHELYNAGEVPLMPIYVDSPLASKITQVFGEHPEVFDADTHKTFLERGQNPFFFEKIHFISSVEESMRLMRDETPHIVIAGSGMCEAGRILHHLRHKIHNPRHTILIVGFMAENTLGRRILERGMAYAAAGRTGTVPLVRFLNKEYPLKAHVVKMGGFSAHADRTEMLKFLKESNLDIRKIAVVHGEEEQSLSFGRYLEDQGYSVTVPLPGETVVI